MKNVKHIVILVLPQFTLLNMAAPLEVFTRAISEAQMMSNEPDFVYQTHIISSERENQIITSAGIPIITEENFQNIDYDIDTLIVGGISGDPNYEIKQVLLEWIVYQSKNARRICSICAGAFLLAEAGVLNGKRATTHWNRCDKLAEDYPLIRVEVAPLYVKDGNIYTSAGISSGMDLALALLEEDMGRAFALGVAKMMVLFLKRPGNQVQYSNLSDYQRIPHLSIRKICEWLLNHLHEDLTIEQLAEEVDMSPRNFARVFVREMNITPAKYIDRLRVERASQYLVESQYSFDQIGEKCGVKNADNLRRLFLKVLETTPSAYRKNFTTTVSEN